MIASLEALVALAHAGTMTRAATELRITQSAVSRRIAALAAQLDVALVERDGRRVRLTPAARELLERTEPLLAELRSALTAETAEAGAVLVLGASESILASWGAPALASVRRALPHVELRVNAHRSPVAVDRVRSGEYALALVAGDAAVSPDLGYHPLGDERMVVVASRGERPRLRAGSVVDVVAIESGSATWRAIKPQLARLRRERGISLRVSRRLQSFTAIVQLARAGFGHALAPLDVARALGVSASGLVELPRPGVTRPLGIVGRRATLSRPVAASVCAELARARAELA